MLLRANEAAGTIRPGLDPDDVLLILGFLWRIDPKTDWRSRSSRLLDLLMDGLRAGAPASRCPHNRIARLAAWDFGSAAEASRR